MKCWYFNQTHQFSDSGSESIDFWFQLYFYSLSKFQCSAATNFPGDLLSMKNSNINSPMMLYAWLKQRRGNISFPFGYDIIRSKPISHVNYLFCATEPDLFVFLFLFIKYFIVLEMEQPSHEKNNRVQASSSLSKERNGMSCCCINSFFIFKPIKTSHDMN